MAVQHADRSVLATDRREASGSRWSATLGRWRRLGLGVAGVVIVLGILETGARTGVIDPDVVPPVAEIGSALAELLATPQFYADLGATLGAWAAALVIATLVGTVVGIAIGRTRFLYAGMRPIVDGLRSTSAVALIPLAVLFFGVGSSMKVALAVYAALWPVMLGGIHGSAGIDRTLVDVTRILHWSRWRRARLLVLPSTAPYLAAALRTSSLVVLVVVVSAEIITGANGLGRFVAATQQTGVGLDRMYAAIAATGVIGLLLDTLIARLQAVVIRWQPSNREA